MANTRYHHNFIHSLHFHDETLTSHVDIANAFTTYFSNIFGAPHHSILHANWGTLYPNYEWSSWKLEHPFNEEEIRDAIFGLGAEKSPGPDGFSIIFLQKFWELVKPDVLSLFSQFYNGAMDLWHLNYALIALILKTEGASLVNKFRLISLLNVVIKIITKVLANRLRPHIQLLVEQVQSAFTKNIYS